jgi:hypothetical protein
VRELFKVLITIFKLLFRIITVAIQALVLAFFDPLVVVTMMTTLGLIVGLLAYNATSPSPSRGVVVLCWVIGLIGLFTVFLQIYRITKRKNLSWHLANFWVLGSNISTRCLQHEDYSSLLAEAEAWQKAVEGFLRKEFDESYVAKLNSTTGNIMGTPTSLAHPHNGLWMAINNRLIWLHRFSKEIVKN